ncbi:hypothetical protein GCM10029992_26800 [Glycomyces albus]
MADRFRHMKTREGRAENRFCERPSVVTALDQRTTATTPGVERATLRQWLAVAAVALGVFAVITAELLPVGLLTDIGADLGVSAGRAGLMVTVPGLVAAATAPISIVLAGRTDRRRILLGLAVLVAGANFAAALTEDFALMLAARVLVGVTIGAFWSIAGGSPCGWCPSGTSRARPR